MNANRKNLLVVPALVTLGLFGMVSDARANHWHQIDLLALRVRASTELLHEEATAHFRHTPSYAAFDQNVCAMARVAGQLHQLAIGVQCPRQLEGHVRTLNVLHRQSELMLAQMGQWGQIHPIAYRNLAQGIQHVGCSLGQLNQALRALSFGHQHGRSGVGQPGFGHHHGQPALVRPGFQQPTPRGVQRFPQVGGQRFPQQGFQGSQRPVLQTAGRLFQIGVNLGR